MPLEFHAMAVLFVVAAMVSLAVAVLIFQRQNVKGGVVLAILMLEFAAWAAVSSVRWSLAQPLEQIPWLRLAHAALVPAPLTLLLFVAQLTDADRWLTRSNIALLAIEPVVTIMVIALNGTDSLYHSSFPLIEVHGAAGIGWERGPWFWLHTAFSYAFVLTAVVVLVRAIQRAGPFTRGQLNVVLVGCVLPWAVNLYTLASSDVAGQSELGPLAAVASGLLFAYALFRQRLLDIAPVARSLLFEGLGDAVVVVDMSGRVVDMNSAAHRLLGVKDNAYGKPATEIAPQWMDLAETLEEHAGAGPVEAQGRLDPSHFYDITVIGLADSRGRRSGYLVSARDVTERKHAEMELHRANLRLRRQVQKISSLHEELREQAIRDALTGLYNRRYLDETLEREFSRAARGGYPVSIILIDADHFKRVNDTYGHKAGDRVLRAMGEIIRQNVRASDIPCRFGGVVFVIVLPATSPETAFQRAEQIRAQFQATRFFRGREAVVLGLSIGIAVYPKHGKTEESILHSADRAMYTAKANGGNRTVRYNGRQTTMPLQVKEKGK